MITDILWLIVVGVPSVAFFLYISGLLGVPFDIYHKLRPRKRFYIQTDLYPYLQRVPYEFRDMYEYEMYGESSAVMDEEDEEE